MHRPSRIDPRLTYDATGRPICPTAEVWAALSPAERADLSERIRLGLVAVREAQPPQGTPHERAIRRTLDRVERQFDRKRRGIFLASDLPVEYPGAAAFAPDLLAVLDVATHDRNAWNVATEGRGLDFVLEVHFAGDASKDLRENVERYAGLGIPEYFVYDGARRRIAAWHLDDDAARYLPVLPQYGRYPSRVLGLEFAVVDDALRVYVDGAEILNAKDEIVTLVAALNDRERALAAEAARAESEAARAESSLDAARRLLEAVFESRGLALTEADRTRIRDCDAAERLTAWGLRALTATTAAEALAD
jgi:Uma2 family endonuclease